MARDEFSELEEELVQKLPYHKQEYDKASDPITQHFKLIKILSDDEFRELVRVSDYHRTQIREIEQTLENIKEARSIEQKIKNIINEQAARRKKLKEIQRNIADLELNLGVFEDTRSQPRSKEKEYVICKKCNGKGMYIGWFSPSCPRCGGRGIEPGTVSATCGYCGGRKKILETCSECGGKGAFFR